MIDIKDIRIGNWLNWKGNDAPKEGIDFQLEADEFAVIEKMPQRYRSIPITEDWLLKFGFTNTIIGVFEKAVLNRGSINIHISSNKLNVELGTTGHYLFGDTEIKHVHELQNLYYSITKEELIKE